MVQSELILLTHSIPSSYDALCPGMHASMQLWHNPPRHRERYRRDKGIPNKEGQVRLPPPCGGAVRSRSAHGLCLGCPRYTFSPSCADGERHCLFKHAEGSHRLRSQFQSPPPAIRPSFRTASSQLSARRTLISWSSPATFTSTLCGPVSSRI